MSTQQILGLVGKLGAGKDTVAAFLVEKGWQRVAFADALYNEVSEAFNVSVDFLRNRDTKETDLPELSLVNCKDSMFVSVFLHEEQKALGVEHFAGPELVQALNQPRSPRRILQLWGTDYRRVLISDSYWRDIVARMITENPTQNFVISDVRFPNEADLLIEMGASIARVVRPAKAVLVDARTQHASEVAMDDYPISILLDNQEGPEGLKQLKAQTLELFMATSEVA